MTDSKADSTRTDVAVDQIRQRIVLGTFPPGTRLRADALATELGVSRVPLREAFRELVAEGLVETFAHRGAVVSELRVREVEDCYRLLEELEAMAAERAAITAPESTARAMAEQLDVLERLGPHGDPVQRLLAHRSFHFAAFDALGQGALRRHVRMLWHTCERFMNLATRGRRWESATDEHHQLVRYCAAGDSAMTSAIARVHVQHGRTAALRALTEQHPEGPE